MTTPPVLPKCSSTVSVILPETLLPDRHRRASAVAVTQSGEKQHQQDRDQAAKTCTYREEQHACANGGTKQSQRPVVSDLRRGRFVWPTIMLSVLLIGHPYASTKPVIWETREIDIAAGNNADGFAPLNIMVELAAQ